MPEPSYVKYLWLTYRRGPLGHLQDGQIQPMQHAFYAGALALLSVGDKLNYRAQMQVLKELAEFFPEGVEIRAETDE